MQITVHIETLSNLSFWARECGSQAITCARKSLGDFRKTAHHWTNTRENYRSDRASIRWKNMAALSLLEGCTG
jgi:hypothetical protein